MVFVSLIVASLTSNYSRNSGRFRTLSSSSDDPGRFFGRHLRSASAGLSPLCSITWAGTWYPYGSSAYCSSIIARGASQNFQRKIRCSSNLSVHPESTRLWFLHKSKVFTLIVLHSTIESHSSSVDPGSTFICVDLLSGNR